jgi:hypothetical protein
MDWRTIVGTLTVGGVVGLILMFFWKVNIKTLKLVEAFPPDSKLLTQFSLFLTQLLVTGGFLFFLVLFSQPYFPLNWAVPFFAALLGLSPLLKSELKKTAKTTKEGKTTESAEEKNKEG